jgi:hypothetical protein
MSALSCPKSISSSLCRAASLLLCLFAASCGGSDESTTTQPTTVVPDFVVSIESIQLEPGVPSIVTVLSGVRPFRATSENSAVLPVPSVIEGTTLILQASNVKAATTVKIDITDGNGRKKTVTANIAAPAPLSVVPANLKVYSGIPATLTVVSGVQPIRVVSDNPAVITLPATVFGSIIPVLAANVTKNTKVLITLVDGTGKFVNVNVEVESAALLQEVAITRPAASKCKETQGNTVCSGETANLRVRAVSATGSQIAGRSIRADVILGEFGFATSSGITPATSTSTGTTDLAGFTDFRLAADLLINTQIAVVRLTDIPTGSFIDFPFSLLRAVGSKPELSVLPTEYSVKGFTTKDCGGGTFDLVLYGGEPPYILTGTLPGYVLFSVPGQTTRTQTVVVRNAGGTARVHVTGSVCSASRDSQVYITDQTGQAIVAKISSSPGSEATPTPTAPASLAFAPATVTVDCRNGLPRNVPLSIVGGTPPYRVDTQRPLALTVSGTSVIVEPPGLAAGTTTILSVVDSAGLTAQGSLVCE